MSDEIFNELKIFSEEIIGTNQVLLRETRLYEDLGIYGDDAIEYLIAFGKKFNVEVSKFMAADYFKGEGIDLFAMFRKVTTYKPLTLGQLEKAIIAGKLNDEVINKQFCVD
jgi:hypothetical protein